MAEAYFGLRRTRKRTHPNRCPCCNSENESEHHANDEKQEEVVNSSIYSSQPKRSSRIHSKKEKKVKKNEQEKSKSSFQSTDTEVEKNSDVSSNQRSSWQASPGKQRPTRSKRGKAKKSGASVNKNSKINLSGQDQVENLGENFEEKTFRQTEIDFKKRNKKGKKIEAKSVKDWDLKNLNVQKKKKTNKQFCSAAESKEKSSIPQFLNSTERTIKKKNKNLSPKGIYDGGSSITIQDVSIRDSTKKGKGAKKLLSSSVEDNNKKPFVSKEDFDDADDLPLSFTKATVLETKKSNKKTSKDNKVNIQDTKPSAPEMGAQKMKVSYSNFDEMSRNKLEAFDHVFKELKKCPGYSKLTVSGAVDIVMKIGKEQLKPIINSLDMHSDKKRSSTHKTSLPKENDQLSPPIKKKRKTPTNSEENESRSKETAKETMSKDTDYTFVSNSPPKIDCNAEKRQEMNECQAAEALLNFKIKPAVSRSDSFNSTKSNLSSKEEAGEAVTERNSSLKSDTVGEREVSVSLNSINIESATKTSSTSTAESLLQTQSKTSQMSNEMIGESKHAPMPAPHQPSAVPNVQASQLPSITTLQPVDTDLNEAVKGMVEHNKASENSVSITDQVAKAIDSLGHIFDQNQRQFSGFPLPAVMPQNPGFNPVSWPQTISASMGQFGNVSASLPSNVHPVAPPGLNQITPQAFTHVLSQVMSQSKQSLLPVMPGNPSTPQAFLPTAGPLGLGPQQSSQTSPMSITDTQPKPNNQPVTQPKSQLPLKSMEEIVGNVGQTGIPQAVGWSFPTSQAPVVYLASPQTLGGVPRNIVPSTQGSGGVHLGQESIFKPVSSKVTMTKPDLAPASGLSRTTQGVTQTILSTIGKRPILPREKATSSFVQPETVAAHKLPPVVSLATSRTTASKQNLLSTSNLVSSQQKAVSANVTLTTTVNAKQAVKKLVRERTKSAELKRQDSFGSGSDGVSPSALQPSKSQITRPNEFNVEQAASALLSIGKTESPEGNTASHGDDGQEGQDEKVVFTSKGMFRVGDVEVDPQYNRIGREGYTCGKCGKIFTSLNYLARHIKRVCPDMSCRKWKCNQCDKAFRHPFGLQQHVYTHTGERPHKCSQCPKAFYSSNDLRRHSRIHSGERPYRCKHCDKSFATTISLKTHTYIHTGEKPHKCPHCPKTFATSSKLGRHIVTHSEQRPFACQQCPKSFNRSGDLRRHSLHVHENNEKPFECDECFKPFATSVCLKIHKNIHKVAQTSNDNEKPFKCPTCDRTYDSSTQLEKHQMTHVPSAPLGYNYKQFHPIAPKPSDPEQETGNAESSEAKLI